MTGFLCKVLASACALGAVSTGCRSNTPLAIPDAMRANGLTLTADPAEMLTIRPASSGRLEFQLRDEQGQPVPDYPIDFKIVGRNGDGGTVEARLSTDRALTNGKGSAVLEVISDRLDPDVRAATFVVQATSQGAEAARVEVMVTPNAYSVQIAPVAAADLITMGTMVRTQLSFFDDATCSALDLANLSAAPLRPRTPHDIDIGGSFIFSGVSGQGSHAVAGLGLDASNAVRIAGCLDLPGSLLLEDQTIIATLLLDRLLPVPTGDYRVASDIFWFPSPAPQPVAAIQAAWQEWSRCPLDPARLWLDCTIDSLVTNSANDPNDCVPVAGGEGSLGGQLDARRGITLQTVSSAPSKSATPCHDNVDRNGATSLEAVVDALFDRSHSQLGSMNLGAFSSEIAGLLSALHINSTMRITADKQPNSYVVDHDLVDISFPAPLASALTFKVTTLGLPEPGVHGVLASMKFGQLLLPRHGFTLRLGTATKYAFESSSLQKSRSVAGVTELVNAVFDTARLADQDELLTGCNALDAALCDQIKESRGCLLGACRTGLTALAQKLSASFGNLDGDGLDFFLSGSVPVVDLNGDGRTDALGVLRTSAGTVASGSWRGEVRANPVSPSVDGTWSATRTDGSH